MNYVESGDVPEITKFYEDPNAKPFIMHRLKTICLWKANLIKTFSNMQSQLSDLLSQNTLRED